MTISQIYKKYMTPKNLQEHMLRVAALAKIITDNWNGKTLNSLAIINACLMHDISKPANFDTSKEAQEKYKMDPKDVAGLIKLKRYITDNFGTEEHKAAVLMAMDAGFGKDVAAILDQIEWEYAARLLKEKNTEALIALYCDMRIGPHGILSLQKRFADLKARRGGNHDDYLNDALKMEEFLQKNTIQNLTAITEKDLTPLFSDLSNLKATP